GPAAVRMPTEFRDRTVTTASTQIRSSAIVRLVRRTEGNEPDASSPSGTGVRAALALIGVLGQAEAGPLRGLDLPIGTAPADVERRGEACLARGDQVHQAGLTDDHLDELAPVDRAPCLLRREGQLSAGLLVGVGRDLDAVADLPVDLDHQCDQLLARQRLV